MAANITAADWSSALAQLTAQSAELAEMKTMLESQAGYSEALDNIWMLYTASLIFFMNPGFAFLEAGSVRFKNTQHILAKNMIVPVICFLVWYIIGFPIAFGATDPTGEPNTPGKFASGRYWAMAGFYKDRVKFRNWFFQGCFCETAATIVSGATAERMNFWAFLIFTVFVTGIIYPVVVYWCWSLSGWLQFTDPQYGVMSLVGPAYIDFAGSGVIHLLGGVAGLVGAIVVGPRKGRFDPALQDEFSPHSVNFCVLGTFILWFGWYGFNPGSTGAMHDAATANRSALVAVNTSLAPCAAGLVVFCLRFAMTRRLDVCGLCNGILAGLVGITAGCAVVAPWEAILIGIIAAFVYQGSSMLLPRLRIDDPVEAVSVHAANGAWGVLAAGLFGDPAEGMGGNGAFYVHGHQNAFPTNGTYRGGQLGTQVVAVVVIILWTVALSLAVFVPLRLLGYLRVSDEFQDQGADEAIHSPSKAYSAEPHSPSKPGLTVVI
jgi:ammonium transporter, Amt family